MLRALGVRYVIVHPEDYDGAARAERIPERTIDALRSSGQIAKEAGLPGTTAFELTPWTPPDERGGDADRSGRADRVGLGSRRSRRRISSTAISTRAGLRGMGGQDGSSWVRARSCASRRRRARRAADRGAIDQRLSADAADRRARIPQDHDAAALRWRAVSGARRGHRPRRPLSDLITSALPHNSTGRPLDPANGCRRARPGRSTSCACGGMIRPEVFDEAFSCDRSCRRARWWRFR